MLPYLLLLAAGAAVGVAYTVATRTPDPMTDTPHNATTLWVVGDAILELDGELDVRHTPAGAVVTLNAPGLTLTLERGWDIDTGTFAMAGLTGCLLDEITPADATLPQGAARGLTAHFAVPDAKLCRMRQVFVGTTDPVLGPRLLTGFQSAESPKPDNVVPWTLASATRYVAATMARDHGVETEVIDEGEIQVNGEGGPSRVSLHNIWPDVRDSQPTEGQGRLRDFARSMCRIHEGTPTDRDQVTPRLWPWVEEVVTTTPGGETVTLDPARRRVAEDLMVLYMQDLPDSMRSLSREQVEAIEPDPDALATLATDNLFRLQERIKVMGEGPVFMVTCDGIYEASLMLVPEVCAYLDSLIDGPRLVAVPARDLLFVTGDTGPERRAMLAKLAAQPDLSYPISSSIYRWDGSEYRRIEV